MKKRVDVLIIGAGRSGTTSLFKMLESHPQICFSRIKEVHFFSVDDLYDRGEAYYLQFFSHKNNAKIWASADTYLLTNYKAIEKIKAYNPKMKIIIMLRNPVDRAYSSYNYSVNYGYHKAYSSFIDSINHEKNIESEANIIKQSNLGHFYGSLYYKHISEWLKFFSKEKLLLLRTQELKSVDLVQAKISEFLQIETFKISDNQLEKQNPNAVPKFKAFEQFLLNRDNPIRKFIRWAIPQFIKNIVIKSNVVDKLHDINRQQSEYSLLDDHTRKKASAFFKNDLQKLNEEFNIQL